MNIGKLTLFSILLAITFCIIQTTSVNAAILFQDNFDDNDTSDWTITRNTCSDNWQTLNGQYGILINGPCVTETIPTSLQIPNTIPYKYEVDMTIPNTVSMDRNFVFKYKDPQNWYGIHIFEFNIYLQKVVNGIEYFLPNWLTTYQFQAGQTYKFKVEINNTNFKVYINNILIQEVEDNIPTFPNSTAGLQASGGGGDNSDSEVWFDNIIVSDLPLTTPTATPTLAPTPTPTVAPTNTPTPTPALPSLNVPDIKQFSTPWKNQIYDHATLWTTNTSIERWGCALTSATMILQYYGFNINPGQLNTWLNSQPDGYIPNGLVNWLAISRYTKTHSNNDQPSLEFKWLTNSQTNLINELNNNRPAILAVPNHFVVAKSQLINSFGINDPAYSNRPTLASYNNSFIQIGSYIPSHTDLSYIMLTINPQFNLKVYDSNHNELLGNTFIQEPLKDDVNNSSLSGNPVKFYMFPKPANGLYTAEITGIDNYEIGSYLYDINGNVITNKISGILSSTQTDKLTIKIGQNNQITQNISINSILLDLENANNQNKINNNKVYLALKLALQITKELLNQNKTKLAKLSLEGTIALLKLNTPKYIDKQTSQILQSEINILIASL